jgi:predicted RNA methylase
MKLTDETYLQVFERVGKNDMQNVFTPPRLIRRMLSRVNFMSNDKVLVWYNVELVIFLVREVGLRPENIYIYTNTQDKLILRNNGYNVIYQEDIDFDKMSKLINVKFDVVIGNPPYQKQVGPKKTEAIWPKFVDKSFEICKEGGYVSLIHPSGWRNVDGKFKDTQKLLLSKNIEYLEIHNEKDGMKTFGAETRYDWYVVKNVENNGNTEIKGQRSESVNINLIGKEFIPNDSIELIYNLVGNKNLVEVLHSYSDYETRKKHMSKTITDEYIYPIVYTVAKGDILKLIYSSYYTNKHFDKSKLIWSNGRITSVGSVIDIDGNYGLTQFAYAIVDEPISLPLIKKVFDSKIFRDLMEDCAVSDMSINRKIIGTFKKDFWRYFLDENNNVIDPNFENVERI